jgi:hypothetical protein
MYYTKNDGFGRLFFQARPLCVPILQSEWIIHDRRRFWLRNMDNSIITKLYRCVCFPWLDLEWWNCMLLKLCTTIESRQNASSHYRIDVGYFLSCCIDPHKEYFLLDNFVTGVDIWSLQMFEYEFVGRYLTIRSNYLRIQDRPHGQKTDHLRYSIP